MAEAAQALNLFEYAASVSPPADPVAPPEGIPEEICTLFERLALEVFRQGYARYSADAILHRIRWHMHVERGDREFKANDHWTASLARWFLAGHPELPGFFETRVRRSVGASP